MKGTVKMWIKATLRNARRPDYAVVTIPFPIPTDQYDSTIKMLEALDIGDPLVRDCKAEEIHGKASVLKCLEERTVNVDELDYLAKRLDSFDRTGLAQFQGMAAKLDLSDMDNGEFCSLTQEQLEHFTQCFAQPETFRLEELENAFWMEFHTF